MTPFWKAFALALAVVRAAAFLTPAQSNLVVTAEPAAQADHAGGSPSPAPATPPAPSSFLSLSDADLRKQVETDPAALGSLSVGSPGSGVLINGIVFPDDPKWTLANADGNFATAETIDCIRKAVGTVQALFPGTPPLTIGDISNPQGGQLRRHAAHQVGRDVDLGFYYKPGKGVWYTPGTAANLDLPRNWALVRSLLLLTDVDTVLLDGRIQKALYDYALSIGEDKAWLGRIFQFALGWKDAPIVHLPLHRTHYHVRFFNRTAQELGRRAYPYLIELKKIPPPVFTVPHYVRAGETLGHIAARYGSSVRAIQQTNGLRGNIIRAGQTLRVPLKGAAAPPAAPLIIPARPLAPRTPALLAAVEWPLPIPSYGDALTRLARFGGLLGGLPRYL
jgi:penicillin-insensitive murein endopeptidase